MTWCYTPSYIIGIFTDPEAAAAEGLREQAVTYGKTRGPAKTIADCYRKEPVRFDSFRFRTC